MNIIAKKNLFFIISGIIIIPGLISLFAWGLPLGIDFTGGSRLELATKEKINSGEIEKILEDNKIDVHSVRLSDDKTVLIRTETLDQKKKTEVIKLLKNKYKTLSEKGFDTVGPVVGGETKTKAIISVLIASLVITLFIAWAFREVSKPVASWKFGVAAISALLHDVLLVVGVFSLLGHFLHIEVDALFITALLTVMGFSVHDTIVVFDRIRENLRKNQGLPFDVVVNNSILETLNRSLNTSLTVLLVLSSLLVFGGEAIRWFIIALILGIASGTYSSIFNAAPILVAWQEWDQKKRARIGKESA